MKTGVFLDIKFKQTSPLQHLCPPYTVTTILLQQHWLLAITYKKYLLSKYQYNLSVYRYIFILQNKIKILLWSNFSIFNLPWNCIDGVNKFSPKANLQNNLRRTQLIILTCVCMQCTMQSIMKMGLIGKKWKNFPIKLICITNYIHIVTTDARSVFFLIRLSLQ